MLLPGGGCTARLGFSTRLGYLDWLIGLAPRLLGLDLRFGTFEEIHMHYLQCALGSSTDRHRQGFILASKGMLVSKVAWLCVARIVID